MLVAVLVSAGSVDGCPRCLSLSRGGVTAAVAAATPTRHGVPGVGAAPVAAPVAACFDSCCGHWRPPRQDLLLHMVPALVQSFTKWAVLRHLKHFRGRYGGLAFTLRVRAATAVVS